MWCCSCTGPVIISATVRRHHRLRLRRHLTSSDHHHRHLTTTIQSPLNHQNHLKLVINNNLFTEAIEDLKTLITVDDNNRNLILSLPRPHTLRNLTLSIILFILISKALLRLLLPLRFSNINNNNNNNKGMVYRRDRSLGGKQVLVGNNKKKNKVDSLPPPLLTRQQVRASGQGRREEERRLPRWWPVLVQSNVATGQEKAEFQKLADRLIRAILDQRLIGNDISEHDIFQFRRLCRGSSVRVFIETTNARDSFYRASVDFVLKVCESVDYHSSSVNIDGEDAQQFVAGIADNIGVEDFHAARIVAASIAARTRSCFLQAWALEMQGKHSEALSELSKICLLHRIFPPDDNSPEMEMVARGLEKNLKFEQRKFLMRMFDEICRDGNRRSVAEALGLGSLPEFGITAEAS